MSQKQFNTGEVNWDDVDVSATSGSGTPIFLKLTEGEHRVRVVSKPYQYYSHWIEDASGAKKKVNCAMDGCPICVDEGAPKAKWYIRVLYRDPQSGSVIRILDIGSQIFGQIKTLNTDTEWGPVHHYDIKIIRGKKGSNPLYKVNPCPPSQFTQEEKELLKEAINPENKGFIDLAKMCEPWSIEKIQKVLYGEDEKAPAAPTKMSAASVAAPVQNAQQEDEDFLDL